MIIKLKPRTTINEISHLTEYIVSLGLSLQTIEGTSHIVINILGDTSKIDAKSFYAFECVDEVVRIQKPYPKVSKTSPQKTIVTVGQANIGDGSLTIIGGPCAIEDFESFDNIAKTLVEYNLTIMRAGVFKPRTSPYSFQGLGQEALDIIKAVKDKYNLAIVSEITDKLQFELLEPYIDVFQVGARNMQNYELLKALGNINKPVLLKRGFSNTIDEWLMSAEYILSGGNKNIILCERGIRTFDNTYTRNTLDISSIPLIKKLTHLPIIVDPSHAAGRWDLIEDLSLAAVAAGADGLLIEVHHNPQTALSDGAQSLKIEKFIELVKKCRKLKQCLDSI